MVVKHIDVAEDIVSIYNQFDDVTLQLSRDDAANAMMSI
jgi:hypothetical protein